MASGAGNARSPEGNEQALIRRAAALWAHARDAMSTEGRLEFGRLALLYERIATRAARRDLSRATLGDLLYADRTQDRVSEEQWVGLVRGMTKRDPAALQTLYRWTHRLVITLIMGITNDWFVTEGLAVDVFVDLWQAAGKFDPLGDTVVGWVMNHTRSRALERVSREDRGTKGSSAATQVFEVMVDRSTGALPFAASLWNRIAARISTDADDAPWLAPNPPEHEARWEEPAPGISFRMLATETQRGRVSLLVRLAADVEYPPHMHAGVEELHLLQGELWIDRRKLHRGDYHRSEPATTDKRVWSETGCTCVLVTSSRDILG